MKRKLSYVFDTYLSDILLFWFAALMLGTFILELLTTGHTVDIQENNLIILSTEIAICGLSASWAVTKFTVKLRENKN